MIRHFDNRANATDMTTANITCPTGTSYFACADGSRFVGCCRTGSSPCAATGCAAGDLFPAAFDPNQYGNIGDQQCDSGHFYTCKTTDPTFWGCCKTDPCAAGGCRARQLGSSLATESSLTAAYLSNQPAVAEPFLRGNASWVKEQAHASTGTTASPTDSAPTPSTTWESLAPHHHVGAIVGGALGGVFMVIALVLGMLIWRHRRQHRIAMQGNGFATTQESASQPGLDEKRMMNGKSNHTSSGQGRKADVPVKQSVWPRLRFRRMRVLQGSLQCCPARRQACLKPLAQGVLSRRRHLIAPRTHRWRFDHFHRSCMRTSRLSWTVGSGIMRISRGRYQRDFEGMIVVTESCSRLMLVNRNYSSMYVETEECVRHA